MSVQGATVVALPAEGWEARFYRSAEEVETAKPYERHPVIGWAIGHTGTGVALIVNGSGVARSTVAVSLELKNTIIVAQVGTPTPYDLTAAGSGALGS